jgi:hypothetical protein
MKRVAALGVLSGRQMSARVQVASSRFAPICKVQLSTSSRSGTYDDREKYEERRYIQREEDRRKEESRFDRPSASKDRDSPSPKDQRDQWDQRNQRDQSDQRDKNLSGFNKDEIVDPGL